MLYVNVLQFFLCVRSFKFVFDLLWMMKFPCDVSSVAAKQDCMLCVKCGFVGVRESGLKSR